MTSSITAAGSVAAGPVTAGPVGAAASSGSAADTSGEGTAQRWAEVLAEFERSMRTGAEFVAPSVDGPDAIGPMPTQLREHAERLLAECATRAAAVRAEMTEVGRELGTLQNRSTPRGSWTDDGQGSTPGVGHLV
ncbi:MAG: hypothetical protein M3Y51_00780 [Actinomycetota bacterium]|nr:hypothetical protein [Actinomycetota bacterium]